jgi:hypothetical protein
MPTRTLSSFKNRAVEGRRILQKSHWLFLLLATAICAHAIPPTIADPEFDATVRDPRFQPDKGPLVLIDEGHRNFHTIAGRYKPVADVLRNDGYQVAAHKSSFTQQSLAGAKLLIVASAVGDVDPKNPDKWKLPVPSAFTNTEVGIVVDWVKRGGALLLIVDYMPVAGMSANLAAGFGVHVANGYAYESNDENKIVFSKARGSLRPHAITDGTDDKERIDSVHTFAGTALLAPIGGQPLLMFGPDAYIVMPTNIPPPDTAPPEDAPRYSIHGWSQGTVLEFGQGRVAVFGEAAVFSAQRYPNGTVMGMNHPKADQNKQFLLNLVHWLSRHLDSDCTRFLSTHGGQWDIDCAM